jgi:EAL domain-containing protein (putative c-di-GMP-specific phosphodiesterase class I)
MDVNNSATDFEAGSENPLLKLHSVLEIIPLLSHFADWVGTSVDFCEMRYCHSASGLSESVTLSDTSSGEERVNHSLPDLGNFTFMRKKPFNEQELDTLSHCLKTLHGPLSNALRYHDAMRQCEQLTQRLQVSDKTCTSLTRIDNDSQQMRIDSLVSNNELHDALLSDSLTVFYQPKVDIKSGEVKGLEALLRWYHADIGLLTPEQFIPLAEQNGLITAVTRWVLNAVLRQCAYWQKQDLLVPVAVNLSGLDLEDTELPDYLAQLLERWNIPAQFLELEITETAAFDDHAQGVEILQRLSDLGVAVAIDDFGIGYSSLHRLKHLPIDTIKIDKSFIMEEGRGENDMLFVDTITRLGHKLGMKVVAEGVDSHESMQRLQAAGCDMAQGYHISHPLSDEAVTGWLRNSANTSMAGQSLFH